MYELIYWHVRRPLSMIPYKIANLMPRWLVYHCTIRLVANATCGQYGNTVVPELTACDALQRWEKARLPG